MSRRFVTYDTEDQKAGLVNVDEKGVLFQPDGLGYKTVKETTIVDNATVTIAVDCVPVNNPFEVDGFVEGASYAVTWDGTVYECTSYFVSDIGSPVIGNGAIGGVPGGNDEPFFVAVDGDTVMLFSRETGEHVINIVQVDENIRKIPAEYLPDNPITHFYTDETLTDEVKLELAKNLTPHRYYDPYEKSSCLVYDYKVRHSGNDLSPMIFADGKYSVWVLETTDEVIDEVLAAWSKKHF